MTRAHAVRYVQVQAVRNGHRLGPAEKGAKWIAQCRACGALAAAEPLDDRGTHWGACGNTIRRTCAGVQWSTHQRQAKAFVRRALKALRTQEHRT